MSVSRSLIESATKVRDRQNLSESDEAQMKHGVAQTIQAAQKTLKDIQKIVKITEARLKDDLKKVTHSKLTETHINTVGSHLKDCKEILEQSASSIEKAETASTYLNEQFTKLGTKR